MLINGYFLAGDEIEFLKELIEAGVNWFDSINIADEQVANARRFQERMNKILDVELGGKHMKTKNVVAHTPTPWVYDGHSITTTEDEGFQEIAEVKDDGGNFPSQVESANAEFIVRAVNSHEALLVALKDMSKTYHEVTNHRDYFHNCAVPWCVENRKIIAQAEGHQGESRE